ncbi:MAG: type IV secretory system conjugative DNA transfer family protein [Eubacterium sp.]|nr:type IV secretory system conjugative DNA transfer family protein [Eubacterium sp.]
MDVMNNMTKFSGKGSVINNLKYACEYYSDRLSGKRRRELITKHYDALGSYIITDINGRVTEKCEEALFDSDYRVNIFDLLNFEECLTRFNPLDPKYLPTEADIISLASVMVDSVIGNSSEGSVFHTFDRNSFWRTAAKSLLAAYISYIQLKAPFEEMSIATLMELLDANSHHNDQEVTAVDVIFEKMEKEHPESLAVRQYKVYKSADWEHYVEINDYLYKLLYFYNSYDILRKTNGDNIYIEDFTKIPSVLLVVLSDFDDTYRPFVQVMYHQLLGYLNRQRRIYGKPAIPVITYI